jgi:hypothetical protein
MHALRRECSHRMVTGSVASDMGVVTGARGWKPLGNLFFLNFQTPLKFVDSKRKPYLVPKIFKLFVQRHLNILNNFLHWDDFKLSTEFMF